MTNPASIASLGMLHGAAQIAAIGLLPVTSLSPDFIPGGIPAAGKKSRLRHAARAAVLLELHCAVSASAAVRIGAAAAVDAVFRADSTVGLRLSGRAELAARAEIAIAADVVDVVLEMLLLDA